MTTRKVFILLLNIFSSGFLFSQVQFSSDFESASIGSVKLLDSVWIKSTPTDSMLSLSYEISSRFDPLNPVDTSLSPSARWYYFRITGVKGKQIFLNKPKLKERIYVDSSINFKQELKQRWPRAKPKCLQDWTPLKHLRRLQRV